MGDEMLTHETFFQQPGHADAAQEFADALTQEGVKVLEVKTGIPVPVIDAAGAVVDTVLASVVRYAAKEIQSLISLMMTVEEKWVAKFKAAASPAPATETPPTEPSA